MNDHAKRLILSRKVDGELHRRHQAKAAAAQDNAARLASAAKEAADALVVNDRIHEKSASDVAEALRTSHLATLEMLRETAKHRNAAELSLGEQYPANEKQASDNGNGSANGRHRPVGARVSNWDDTEAGRRFRNGILGS